MYRAAYLCSRSGSTVGKRVEGDVNLGKTVPLCVCMCKMKYKYKYTNMKTNPNLHTKVWSPSRTSWGEHPVQIDVPWLESDLCGVHRREQWLREQKGCTEEDQTLNSVKASTWSGPWATNKRTEQYHAAQTWSPTLQRWAKMRMTYWPVAHDAMIMSPGSKAHTWIHVRETHLEAQLWFGKALQNTHPKV